MLPHQRCNDSGTLLLMANLCSNCRCEPVAAHAQCFADWCSLCNVSLWSTRDTGDDDNALNIPSALCSNCQKAPVTPHPRCFADWCCECDDSLWWAQSDSSIAPMDVDEPAYSATEMVIEADTESAFDSALVRHEEWQRRGLTHCHLIIMFAVGDDDE